MWTNTIGSVDPQAGSNSVIEASLNAPQFGGGRAARRAAAQEAVLQTGVDLQVSFPGAKSPAALHVTEKYIVVRYPDCFNRGLQVDLTVL